MKHHLPQEWALSVESVSKKFAIPHERVSTLRGAFVNMLRPRTYEVFKALDDVSFTVRKGECFGIIGKNGSGKSTLLKMIAGVYVPDTGKIITQGAISPFLELGIGFNPELSGRDNIYINASVLGLLKEEIDKSFDAIVAFSELERFIDQKLKNYSSGMKVRLAFAVAIHANREILLLDEVLAVGDAAFQEKCLQELRRLKQTGKTIILVSHSEQSIREFADRVLVLHKGRVVGCGATDEMIATYNDLVSKESLL